MYEKAALHFVSPREMYARHLLSLDREPTGGRLRLARARQRQAEIDDEIDERPRLALAKRRQRQAEQS